MNLKKMTCVVVCLSLALVSHAQRPFWLSVKTMTELAGKALTRPLGKVGQIAAPSQAEISRVLYGNLLDSYKLAQGVQYSLDTPFLCQICPSKKITGALNQEDFSPAALTSLYPGLSFQTSRQLSNYFLTNNNNLAVQEQQRVTGWLTQLAQHSASLQQEAAHLEQPTQLAPWLAAQLPLNTKTLFLGEMHRQENIKRFLTQFLTQLRNTRPKQPIFLFTEFLPSRFIWTPYHDPAIHPYGRVWKAAEQMNIQIVGLEPEYVQDNLLFLEYKTRNGQRQKASIWSSLEGMRLRNAHYKEVINDYRRIYPDALFIVYTGADHSQYTSPFSLSKDLPPEETVVTSLFPAQRLAVPPAVLKTEGIRPFFTSLSSDFDFATGGKFPQRVLYWKDKDSARATGFDFQLKLSDPIP